VKARVRADAAIFAAFLIFGLVGLWLSKFPVDKTVWWIGFTVFAVWLLIEICFVSPYRHAQGLTAQIDASESKLAVLEEASKPRIKISCAKDIEGCVVPDHQGIWYRARLDLTGNNVSGLEASVTDLWENGVKQNLYGEYMILQMCMSEQLGKTTTIHQGRPEYINLAFVSTDPSDDKLPFLTLKHYPGSVSGHFDFKPNQEYQLGTVLNCDDTHPTLYFTVKLSFRGNKGVELSCSG